MAGDVLFPFSTPGRKQWNIKDMYSSENPWSKINAEYWPGILKSADNEKNARHGAFCPSKASEQGNVEATNTLRSCTESGERMSKHNYFYVNHSSQNEKLAKAAAWDMFLSLSAGKPYVTCEQLRRRMREVVLRESASCSKETTTAQNGCTVEPLRAVNNPAEDGNCNYNVDNEYPDDVLDWEGRGEASGEMLTEEHLENAAVMYARGELPLVHRVLILSDSGNREMRNLNFLQRVVLHPFQTLHQSYLKLLDHFSCRHWNRALNLLLTLSFIPFVLFLFCYPQITFDNFLLLFPMFIYYLSFFSMVLTTLQMLQAKREYADFRVWSRLLLSYDSDGNLNTDDAEFEYCRKNMKPFLVYFLSLFVNLISYAFMSELWIPLSEFALVAIVLTFSTLYFFLERLTTRKLDMLMLISFGIYVVAKYPYEADSVGRQTWRVLDLKLPILQSYGLPCFATQMIGSGVEFCLNFRFIFYIALFPIFFKMASRENWRGMYKFLLPHCVTLAWWQMAVLCCQGATLYGLLRSTLALVGLVFFLPIVGIATIMLPILAVLKHFTDVTFTPKTGLTTVLASIPLAVAYFLDKRRGAHFGTLFSKIQVILAVASVIFLVYPSVNEYFIDVASDTEMQTRPKITWDQYSSACRRVFSPSKRTLADVQHECAHFHGVTVNWEGVVEDVRIVRITNNFLKIVDHFPEALRLKLICLYGEKYEEDCAGLKDETKLRFCETLKQVNPNYKCHARSWDRYDFEMKLRMKPGTWNDAYTVVYLEADDNLRNFTLHLNVKDRIWFSGSLTRPETIGSEQLMISVDEMGCINCENKSLTSQKSQKSKFRSDHFVRQIQAGLKRVLNFVFHPVVIFR